MARLVPLSDQPTTISISHPLPAANRAAVRRLASRTSRKRRFAWRHGSVQPRSGSSTVKLTLGRTGSVDCPAVMTRCDRRPVTTPNAARPEAARKYPSPHYRLPRRNPRCPTPACVTYYRKRSASESIAPIVSSNGAGLKPSGAPPSWCFQNCCARLVSVSAPASAWLRRSRRF